jgi:hypothetical protein
MHRPPLNVIPSGARDLGSCMRSFRDGAETLGSSLRDDIQERARYTPTGKGLLCVSALIETPENLPCRRDISPVYQ